MIFTKEFIDTIKHCKTSEQLSEKLNQAEEVIGNLRKMRGCLEQKEID